MGSAEPRVKPYGSNDFGEWIVDQHGNPAYKYTCDQTHDPKAWTNIGPGLLSPTDHIHQIGNDRIVGIASNYGWVQVRQDEGGPKILNGYNPERSQYAGGFGFLSDKEEVISTFYSGENAEHFERVFGMGYMRKVVRGQSYTVDQVVHAPFGDDPVLVSQVTITNETNEVKTPRWVEYWGCQPYILSFRLFLLAHAAKCNVAEKRHCFAERYSHEFQVLENGAGLVERKVFLGSDKEEDEEWEALKVEMAAHPTMFAGGVVSGPLDDEMAIDGLPPPSTFLVSLDAPASGVFTDEKDVFESLAAPNPVDLKKALNGRLELNNEHSGSAMLLQRHLQLQPGEMKSIYFLYGYCTEESDPSELIAKYRKAPADVWAESGRQWNQSGMKFNAPDIDDDNWIARETAWHYYYLRSSQTFDSYFQEHTITQAAQYIYVMGHNSSARDPLQFALPLVFTDPELVKAIIRYTLKTSRPDGSIPYGIVGHGMLMPTVMDDSSDFPLFLLWLASEYVLGTRDAAFLDETISTYPLYQQQSKQVSIRAMLRKTFNCLQNVIGYGIHDLIRQKENDWNDAITSLWIDKTNREECIELGESVSNSAMACYVFEQYARMLRFTGDDSGQEHTAIQAAAANRKAVLDQWAGQWFRRAWLGPSTGWLGEKNIWLEPQPWALIGDVTDAEKAATLVHYIETMLRQPSALGAMQQNGSGERMAGVEGRPLGMSVNGGIWPALNLTLVWGLARQGYMDAAWDEFKKNSLAHYANVYPHIWYGAWSSLDSVNAACAKNPGRASVSNVFNQEDFPVTNMHAHAPKLESVVKLIGVEFTEEGLVIAPAVPLDRYAFESPLVSFRKSAYAYEGWYNPAVKGDWHVEIKLPVGMKRMRWKVIVNETLSSVEDLENKIKFSGRGGGGKALTWKAEWISIA